MTYASAWKRIIAYFIDIIMIAIPVVLAYYFLFDFNFIYESVTSRSSIQARILFLQTRDQMRNVILLSYIIYAITSETILLHGTLGKIALGLHVGNDQGNRLSLWRVVVRNAFKIVTLILFGLPFIVAFFSKNKQAWYDMLASSYVYSDTNAKSSPNTSSIPLQQKSNIISPLPLLLLIFLILPASVTASTVAFTYSSLFDILQRNTVTGRWEGRTVRLEPGQNGMIRVYVPTSLEFMSDGTYTFSRLDESKSGWYTVSGDQIILNPALPTLNQESGKPVGFIRDGSLILGGTSPDVAFYFLTENYNDALKSYFSVNEQDIYGSWKSMPTEILPEGLPIQNFSIDFNNNGTFEMRITQQETTLYTASGFFSFEGEEITLQTQEGIIPGWTDRTPNEEIQVLRLNEEWLFIVFRGGVQHFKKI